MLSGLWPSDSGHSEMDAVTGEDVYLELHVPLSFGEGPRGYLIPLSSKKPFIITPMINSIPAGTFFFALPGLINNQIVPAIINKSERM
jgi:hypothetical protein